MEDGRLVLRSPKGEVGTTTVNGEILKYVYLLQTISAPPKPYVCITN